MLYNGDMASEYTLITYNGKNEKYVGQKVRQYLDGSIRDSRGYFIEAHPEGTQITSGDARALASKRWQKYQKAAADALRDELGSVSPGATTPFAVWGVLVADQATKLLDYPKPRVRELQHLGQIIGAVPTAMDNDQQDNANVVLPEGVASKLLDLLSGTVRQDADVIDIESE